MCFILITDGQVSISTLPIMASEDDMPSSHSVCVELVSTTAMQYQNDIRVTLTVVAGKAGMLPLD